MSPLESAHSLIETSLASALAVFSADPEASRPTMPARAIRNVDGASPLAATLRCASRRPGRKARRRPERADAIRSAIPALNELVQRAMSRALRRDGKAGSR